MLDEMATQAERAEKALEALRLGYRSIRDLGWWRGDHGGDGGLGNKHFPQPGVENDSCECVMTSLMKSDYRAWAEYYVFRALALPPEEDHGRNTDTVYRLNDSQSDEGGRFWALGVLQHAITLAEADIASASEE